MPDDQPNRQARIVHRLDSGDASASRMAVRAAHALVANDERLAIVERDRAIVDDGSVAHVNRSMRAATRKWDTSAMSRQADAGAALAVSVVRPNRVAPGSPTGDLSVEEVLEACDGVDLQPAMPAEAMGAHGRDGAPRTMQETDWYRLAIRALGGSVWLWTSPSEALLVAGELPGRAEEVRKHVLDVKVLEALAAVPPGQPAELEPVAIGVDVMHRTALLTHDDAGLPMVVVVVTRPLRPPARWTSGAGDSVEVARERVRLWVATRALADLTQRELEILTLLTLGHRLTSIASMLYLSLHTVRNYVKSIFRKLDIGSQAALIDEYRRAAASD